MDNLYFAGEKISPIEVDAVLLSQPDVAQAVAFGVPDDKYGEEVRREYCYFLLTIWSIIYFLVVKVLTLLVLTCR